MLPPAAAEGALAQRTNGRRKPWLPPGPALRPVQRVPAQPGQSKEAPAGSPGLKGARRGEHTCGGWGVPGHIGAAGAGPGAEGPAAELSCPTDVLEALCGLRAGRGADEVSVLGVLALGSALGASSTDGRPVSTAAAWST